MSKFQATSEGDVLVLRIPVESINQVTVTTDFTGWGVDPVMFLTLDVNESAELLRAGQAAADASNDEETADD